jgi:ribosomal protein S18 acetylase RimI-like enzyme
MPDSARGRAFVLFTVLTLALMATLQVIDAPLKTNEAPFGILSFEFAGNLDIAKEIVGSWDGSARIHAGFSLGIDYVFLLSYSSAVALGCVLVARPLSTKLGSLAPLGIGLAWAQFVAALLDGVENFALLQVLLGSDWIAWPVVARWCAIPKFAIVIAGLFYVGIGTLLNSFLGSSQPKLTKDTSKHFHVRPYAEADQEQVVDLWRDCALVVPQNDPYRDIALKLQVQPELFLVGTLDDRVVASVMAGYEGHRGWINYLAISPALRRQGLGRKIMEEAEIKLREMGCPKINLQVRHKNTGVIAFYERIGYTKDEVSSFGKRL